MKKRKSSMKLNNRRNTRVEEVKKKISRRLVSWIGLAAVCIVAVIAAYLYVKAFEQKMVVDDSAMEPTYMKNDIVKINKASYILGSPDRFDVVIIKKGKTSNSKMYIRRIVGLPGETVNIADGIIYINGKEVDYPIADEPVSFGGRATEGVTLGDDEYFVLGDNFDSENDSRLESFGNISMDDIIGEVR